MRTPLDIEYRPMIYLAGVLGLRWSEVAGLRSVGSTFFGERSAITDTVVEAGRRGQLSRREEPGESSNA